jgi:hypothetical protein
MKHLMICFFIVLSIAVKAQDVASYGKAPSSMVKLYHPKTEKQTDLENTGAMRKQKKKLGGFGGVSFSYEMEGEKSPLRLNADSAIFVTEQGTGMLSMDMSMTLQLFKLEIKNGKRVAVQGDYKPSLLGSGKTTDTKITTEGNNYDGKNTKYIVYAFGID